MQLALLVFALVLPTLLTTLYFVVLAGGAGVNPVQQAVYVAGKVVQFALPLLDWRLWGRAAGKPILGPAGLRLGLLFGLAVGLGILGLYHYGLKGTWLLADTAAEVRLKVAQMGIGTPAAFFAFAVALSLLHSGLEEYYWRWYAFGRLAERLPVGWANLVAALAFMSHHVVLLAIFFPGRFWVMAVPLSAGVAVGGLFWAWLYHRTGSLLGPWASHALVDAAIFLVGWDMVRPA